MLCEIGEYSNFFLTWAILTILAIASVLIMSGILFYQYYVKVTYEKWIYKSNPEFPKPEKVQQEIIQMFKGIFVGTLCPAISLHLSQNGYSKSYCGIYNEQYDVGLGYLIANFFFIMLLSDFYEFFYHRLGHTTDIGWTQHKYHHYYYNPSPFSVIADEYIDQFIRTMPLIIFPMLWPTNMDFMFIQFAVFFYAYGTYLHWGYEFEILDAHHKYINSAYQHYLHHAKSTKNKPYHTGFFIKLWDNMWGSVYDKECLCSKCERQKGNRSLEKFKCVSIPDYSVLLTIKFWINGPKSE